MIKLLFEPAHRVLMVQVTEVFSSQDIAHSDQAVIAFLARHETPEAAPVRAIYDYSGITALAVPASRMAERSRHPAIVHDKRVLVVRNAVEPGYARAFAEQQKIAGYMEPAVVERLSDAYVLLGLDCPHFEPVDRVVD